MNHDNLTNSRRRRRCSWGIILLSTTLLLTTTTRLGTGFQGVREFRGRNTSELYSTIIFASSNKIFDNRGPNKAKRRASLKLKVAEHENGKQQLGWQSRSSSRFGIRRKLRSFLSATQQDRKKSTGDLDDVTTWSRSGESGSRLGVRKRVKAVLKKARAKTGIHNYSEESIGAVIAEAASIGGFEKASDLGLQGVKETDEENTISAYELTEENIVALPSSKELEKVNGSLETEKREKSTRKSSDIDGIKADVPTIPPEPLPFSLPTLTSEQRQQLHAGERIQEQSRMGREGSGFVVVDVEAPPYAVWESLLDFENYPQMIKTVREMNLFTSNKLKSSYHMEKPVSPGTGREIRHYGTPSVTRAAFILSKFRLKIAAIHNYRPHPEGHYMIFTLDEGTKNAIFQNAKGIWYTESNPDGRGEKYTRVWLLCELKCSRVLPTFIIDYAAKRAMPRATTWLKPYVEAVAKEMALKAPNGESQ